MLSSLVPTLGDVIGEVSSIVLIILILIIVAIFIGTALESVYEKVGSWFHHYTDNESIKKILTNGIIRASTNKSKDAAFGEGGYFTKLPPVITPKTVLAENNYGYNLAKEKLMEGKLDRCVSVFLRDSKVKNVSQNGRSIFLYPGDLFLSGLKYMVT